MSDSYKKILRIGVVVLLDILIIGVCSMAALLARFDFSWEEIPYNFKQAMFSFYMIQVCITVIAFLIRKMYDYVWRLISAYDVADMILSVALAYVISFVITKIFRIRIPNSVAFISLLCQVMALVGMRCYLRIYESFSRRVWDLRAGGKRVMIIGAGEAGRALLREFAFNRLNSGNVCCIIDDNSAKHGKRLDGIPIVGGRDKILETVKKKKISLIIFAIPSAKATDKQEILKICQDTGCKVKMLPGIYDMVDSDKVSLQNVKDVQVEDLLGREPIKLDKKAVKEFMENRVVLVTGGGGSIGSELCRQIAQCNPKKLIILDIYENNAYDIQQELLAEYGDLDLCVEIASIRDKEKTYALFDNYRPDVVFHAAAHKHVPLMESCPQEAIKNNVFGTYHVVRAAEKYGVKKFVMISTDKAVNPTNFMGATKRFCEMILQSRNNSTTEFCAVRFGNVLGSNGSVVPLFKRQIEAGGPVTITDKRIIRYFMTIPEAAQLVLEAGAMAKRGQIFVLDMGEPVKILNLAENLIRLSGLEPYKDIEIKEIGLRPGEKLFEELLTGCSGLKKTSNEKIFIEKDENISPEQVLEWLEELDKAITDNMEADGLILLMKNLVPTYIEPSAVNGQVAEAFVK